MSEQNSESAPAPRPLPDSPNLEWLRKQAKRHLDEMRASTPAAKLADAQFDLAKRYGFTSWRAMKALRLSVANASRWWARARSKMN